MDGIEGTRNEGGCLKIRMLRWIRAVTNLDRIRKDSNANQGLHVSERSVRCTGRHGVGLSSVIPATLYDGKSEGK